MGRTPSTFSQRPATRRPRMSMTAQQLSSKSSFSTAQRERNGTGMASSISRAKMAPICWQSHIGRTTRPLSSSRHMITARPVGVHGSIVQRFGTPTQYTTKTQSLHYFGVVEDEAMSYITGAGSSFSRSVSLSFSLFYLSFSV